MSAVKDVLEGKPFRVPIHAAIVHLPLAFFSVATVLDLIGFFVSNVSLHLLPAAFWSLALGVGTSLVAAFFGFVDYTTIRSDRAAKGSATLHMVLNLICVVVFGISLFLHRDIQGQTPVGALVCTLIAYSTMMVSGYIGGHMVYNEGVSVGRHRRDAPMPERTLDAVASADDWTPLCTADEMVEGEVLRVNIRGTIVSVTKSDDGFYAFQEFCTHRYGPLSEGAIVNGKVICPWHHSCFDIKTGKVCAGPAKLDLITYPVEVRAGKLFIRVPAHESVSRS